MSILIQTLNNNVKNGGLNLFNIKFYKKYQLLC